MAYYTNKELNKLGFKSLGDNVRVSRKASIYGACRIEIGPNTRIDDFSVLSAGENGICIGRNVHIAVMNSLIGKGKIEIGDFCNLSSRVSIYSSSDDYSGEYMTNPTVHEIFKKTDHRDVLLARHVIVGSGSVILPGVTISEGVAIGALSLVKSDLAPYGIYAGSPLKRIKDRSRRLLGLEKTYLENSEKYN